MSKVEIYSTTAETRADGTTIFWRTGQGSHRHASAYCANSKRSIFTGDVIVIPQGEVADWAPCADCCTDADVLAATAAAEQKAAELCSNPGVVHPHRIYSKCTGCGKEGKVKAGKIRAHKPAN